MLSSGVINFQRVHHEIHNIVPEGGERLSLTARASGDDGSLHPWWWNSRQQPWQLFRRPLEPFAAISSSSSGTTLSTNHSSGGSRLSCGETSSLVDFPVVLDLGVDKEEGNNSLQYIQSLADEFCGANNSGLDVVETWIWDLFFGWHMQHPGGDLSTAGVLTEITGAIRLVSDNYRWEQGRVTPNQVKMIAFLKATVSRMHGTIDDTVAKLNNSEEVAATNGAPATSAKLRELLELNRVLSEGHIWFVSLADATGNRDDIVASTWPSREIGLKEAILKAVEQVRIRILSSTDDHDKGTPGIREVTRYAINCITLLREHHVSLNGIVHEAARSVRDQYHNAGGTPLFNMDGADPSTILILDILSSLQEMLARESQSFSSQSLQFLFLLNNVYFVRQQIHTASFLEAYMPVLSRIVHEHMQSYLEVSWVPVLACLYDGPTTLCFGRYSPLPKFESQFQRTYDAQKLWKVPDPELRKLLRKAIIGRVIPGYTIYMEDNSINIPRITPRELEEMLLELFEG
ncbi:unnamed protein product [Urochloa decumbens]|uniref:Exocyst subunit Exo70 family protein n=1 Tax=Urochloa decumbens TaxID=240449 RepID=A0ABC9E1J3_9POAL